MPARHSRKNSTRPGTNVQDVGAGGDADTLHEQLGEVAEVIRADSAVGGGSAIEWPARTRRWLHTSMVAQTPTALSRHRPGPP
jgi:hypothetical protein